MTQFLASLLLYLTLTLTSWVGYQHRYLHTFRGEDIHVMEVQGKQGKAPPLVLFHGLGSQAADLYTVMEPLREQFGRLIAVDLPGHGLNTMAIPNEPLNVLQDRFFHTLHTHLKKKHQQVVLWGNSLGGWQAIHYTLRYPEDVKALILISPAGAEESPEQAQFLTRIFSEYSQKSPEKMLPLLFNQAPPGAELFSESLRARFGTPQIQALMQKVGPEHMAFTREDLGSLSVPTLLIWGKADRIFPQEVAYFKQHLPAASTTILEPEHFTHSPYLEPPMENELSQLTMNWLRKQIIAP